jgi:hypothetical protein
MAPGPVTRNAFFGEGLPLDEKLFEDEKDYYMFKCCLI